MRSIITVAAALCALLCAAPALADDEPRMHEYDVHPSEQLTETRWYGWQNLLVDAGAFGLVYLGAASKTGETAMVGLGVYAVGSPIVHAAHDRWGQSVSSLAMRLVFPLVGGYVGARTCTPRRGDDPDWPCFGAFFEGVLVGAVIAMAIDDLALTHEEVRKEPEFSVIPSSSMVRSPDGKSATPTFGISGVF